MGQVPGQVNERRSGGRTLLGVCAAGVLGAVVAAGWLPAAGQDGGPPGDLSSLLKELAPKEPARKEPTKPASARSDKRRPSAPAEPAPDLPEEDKLEYLAITAQIRGRSRVAAVADQALRPDALVFPDDRDALDVVLRRTRALLADLAPKLPVERAAAFQAALDELSARAGRADPAERSPIPVHWDWSLGSPRRQGLFAEVRALRRRIALANPLLDFDEILFIKKHPARYNHMCDQYFGKHAVPGGGVFILSDVWSDRAKLRDVLARSVVEAGRLKGQSLAGGAFLSPDLSYDGRTIVFAYSQCKARDWSPEASWHLFKVNVDGTGLVQLTDGNWNDFDPCWLPAGAGADGRICFISERRGGEGRCHGRQCPSYTLHSIRPDGTDLLVLSWHETNEWQPSVDRNGMIVYTRWDYVDRGTNQAHHPWITSPDGRDARALHGNFPERSQLNRRPWMEMQIRAIPGSHRYVATAAAHHGQCYGSFVLLDADVEDDGAASQLKRLTPEALWPESEGGRGTYATAWSLSEDYYLCAYEPALAGAGRARGYGKHALYLLDSFGNRELIYRDGEIGCLDPIPLRQRPMPPAATHLTSVRPPSATSGGDGQPKHTAGADRPATVAVMNVYDGLLPWPEGTKIEALRIIHLIPKVTPGAGRPPPGYGNRTNVRQVIGTVPVEPDGSAYFYAPVCKGIYFQALDARGMAVQSMRSLTYVQPGQKLVCQGCHERRWRAPGVRKDIPLALRRPPSPARPDVSGSKPLNFVQLVQPVLDRKCVPCHTKNKGKKAPDLTAEVSGRGGWTASYNSLGRYVAYYNSPKPWNETRTTPGRFGARASKLIRMLDAGHHKVELTDEEFHRIAVWIDCNAGFYGAYLRTAEQAKGIGVEPSLD